MIHRAIRVRDWTADFLFVTGRNDREGVLACLLDLGATRPIVEATVELMDGGLNRGFTFSNTERRASLSWVGPQTSGAEWVNTTVHEIVHVAQAIASADGTEPLSEEFAYLVGDITQGVADIICRLACDHCRERKND